MEVEKKRKIRSSYDERYRQIPSSRNETNFDLELSWLDARILERCLGLERRESIALDAGCGSGRVSLLRPVVARRVVGIDISTARVKIAQKEARIQRAQWVDFLVADLEWLPFRTGVFNYAFSFGMFEYVDKPRKALGELWRTLKYPGKLLLTVHNPDSVLSRILVRVRLRSYDLGISDILVGWRGEQFSQNIPRQKFDFLIRGYNLSRAFVLESHRNAILRTLSKLTWGRIIPILETLELSPLGRFVCTDALILAQKSARSTQPIETELNRKGWERDG